MKVMYFFFYFTPQLYSICMCCRDGRIDSLFLLADRWGKRHITTLCLIKVCIKFSPRIHILTLLICIFFFAFMWVSAGVLCMYFWLLYRGQLCKFTLYLYTVDVFWTIVVNENFMNIFLFYSINMKHEEEWLCIYHQTPRKGWGEWYLFFM